MVIRSFAFHRGVTFDLQFGLIFCALIPALGFQTEGEFLGS
jgi:hypothetical protein